MKILAAIGFVCATVAASAMPTRKDLAKAQEMVNDVTSADIKALKAGTKKPSEVAAAHMALAEKASSEAEKYLLLQGAFNLYAKAGEYDSAANALEAMYRDISEMRPDVIVEIYNKAIFRSMKDKAPRLYAIKEAARKAAANRKRLPALEKAAMAKPQDASVQKALGECQAELGNWDKALAAFAKAGGKVAEIAKSESNGTAKPQDLADFWWDYNDDSSAYKLHAAAFYREALSDDSFNGLARERAERRIKEIEADSMALLTATKNEPAEAVAKLTVPNTFYKGGEKFQVSIKGNDKCLIDFSACPPGEFTLGNNAANKHMVKLTYPFFIMQGPLSYAEADAIDLETAKKGHAKFTAGTESIIPDSPVMELTWNDIHALIAKMNEKGKVPFALKRLPGYEFRLPTEAEWCYAMRGGTDAKDYGAVTSWTKEWAGYWWGKLPNGATKIKDAHYPFAPVPKMRATVNPWGLYYLGPKSVYADTYKCRVGGHFKDLCYVKGDIFKYEASEENPVRIYNGSDAAYHAVYAGRAPQLQPCNTPDVYPKNPFRLVYAPKLSLLNVYPRTANDVPLKTIGGDQRPISGQGNSVQVKPLSFDLGSGIKFQLAHCPAGKFTMSNAPGGPDENGTHEVKITRAYWIAPTRVTREMYKTFEADYDKDEKAKGEKKPGDFVMGRARAEAFAAWLNGKFKAQLPRGYVFRLPTEAEWEHAQQSGATDKNYDFEGTLDTAKAIAKKANAWRFENSVMSYDAVETDPLRLCELNPAWVCRQKTKRFLLPFNGGATFRLVVGPDLLAEKKK